MLVTNIAPPHYLYKYVPSDKVELILSHASLKFSNPSQFNDSFDCNINNIRIDLQDVLDERVKVDLNLLRLQFSNYTLSDDLMEQLYIKSIQNRIDKAAATCFSLTNSNLLMWAHYANGHNGVCIEFDYSLSKEVSFIDEIKIAVSGNIQYDFKDRVNYCQDKYMGMVRLFLSKSSDWEYEEEFRLITLNGNGIYRFNPAFLTKIIFGVKTDHQYINQITELCKTSEFKHVKFACVEFDKGKLVIKDKDSL